MVLRRSAKQSVLETVMNNKVGGGFGMAAVCLVAAGVYARRRAAAAAERAQDTDARR